MVKKEGVVQHIRSMHSIRKRKEKLPPWKAKWNDFNGKYLAWLEKFVEKMIPWLVLILLFVILGEYSGDLNIFHWNWIDQVSGFFHHHEAQIHLLDQVIIGFFIVDLYFNFFKKATVQSFLETSILDIIAVAPMGLIFDFAGVGVSEAQQVLHVTTEVEKEAAVALKETKLASRLTKAEEAARLARLKKGTTLAQRMPRLARFFARLPRFFRLHRLSDFWKK